MPEQRISPALVIAGGLGLGLVAALGAFALAQAARPEEPTPGPWEYGQPSCWVTGSSFPWVWQVRFECLITNPGSVATSKNVFLIVDRGEGWESFGPYPGVLGPGESWLFEITPDTVLISDLDIIAAGIPCFLRDSDGTESPLCTAR